ncbi:MAG TPA: site-specific DNA-methyltransferase, partial [Candidatus Poseidoniales archaeon]
MIVFMNLRHEGDLMAKKELSLESFLDDIHHMDSLEGMKKIPTASIDLVITSPP